MQERCSKANKWCYSYKEAHRLAKKGRNIVRARIHSKVPVRCYHCSYCGCWHLTSEYIKDFYKNKGWIK